MKTKMNTLPEVQSTEEHPAHTTGGMSSKLKWGLASLAIVVTPVGGTALAAHFAGFNLANSLATIAAAILPQATWLSSALTAVGTLGSVWASAAMVAGGLLSVAVIGLSAVLLKAAFSFIYDKIFDSSEASQEKTDLQPEPEGDDNDGALLLSNAANADQTLSGSAMLSSQPVQATVRQHPETAPAVTPPQEGVSHGEQQQDNAGQVDQTLSGGVMLSAQPAITMVAGQAATTPTPSASNGDTTETPVDDRANPQSRSL